MAHRINGGNFFLPGKNDTLVSVRSAITVEVNNHGKTN